MLDTTTGQHECDANARCVNAEPWYTVDVSVIHRNELYARRKRKGRAGYNFLLFDERPLMKAKNKLKN